MNSLPSVTIVIPTIDRPQGVLRAINSLNDQTYQGNIRCVVVDSSMNQETENILLSNSFSSKNLKIEYIKNHNSKRPIDNWILGVNEFSSELGKFLCDDDWLHPDFLLECHQTFTEHSCDAVISNISVVKENGTSVSNYYKFSKGMINKKSVIDSLIGIRNIIPVTPTAGIMKSEILVKSFYESLKQIECTQNLFGFDFYMSYFSTFKGNGAYLIDRSLSYSYAGKDSMTLNVKKSKIAYCYLFALLKLIEESNHEIDIQQKQLLQHKLGSFKLKSFFMNEYKILNYDTFLKPKIVFKLLFYSQFKKYFIKLKYLFKK